MVRGRGCIRQTLTTARGISHEGEQINSFSGGGGNTEICCFGLVPDLRLRTLLPPKINNQTAKCKASEKGAECLCWLIHLMTLPETFFIFE
jgi:hypothetical protein